MTEKHQKKPSIETLFDIVKENTVGRFIRLKARLKEVIFGKVAPAQEQEFQQAKIEIETIGLDGKEDPPKIDLNSPPGHVVPERIADITQELTALYDGDRALAEEVISNIRFVDAEMTERAFDVLAIAVAKEAEQRDKDRIVFVYMGSENKVQSSEGRSKSGQWVGNKLKERIGTEKTPIDVVEIQDFLQEIDSDTSSFRGTPLNKVQVVAADDVINTGEQMKNAILSPLQEYDKRNNTSICTELILAVLTCRDGDYHRYNTYNLGSVSKIYRVFNFFRTSHIPTFTEKLPRERDAVLQFFEHKVADYFYSPLLRSRGIKTGSSDDQKRHWLIDDIFSSPPYDLTRYSKGGSAGAYAKFQEESNPRAPHWLVKQ